MTRPLTFRKRWADWGAAGLMAATYAFLLFLDLGALANTQRWGYGSGIRIFLAVLIPVGYWVLAALCNDRVATVDASAVRVRLLPFPLGSGHSVPRGQIKYVYCRNMIETTDSDVECANFFTAGIETLAGYQLDLAAPFSTAAEAAAAAHSIAQVLNANPAQTPLEVYTVDVNLTNPTFRRQFLLWTAVLALALLAGVAWDANRLPLRLLP